MTIIIKADCLSLNFIRQIIIAFCWVFILLPLFGCSSKPSEGDAKKIIEQHIKDQAEGRMELISFRKTNGMNRNKLYRLEYEAEIEFREDGKLLIDIFSNSLSFKTTITEDQAFSQGGYWAKYNIMINYGKEFKKGERIKYSSSITFEKAEKGWRPVELERFHEIPETLNKQSKKDGIVPLIEGSPPQQTKTHNLFDSKTNSPTSESNNTVAHEPLKRPDQEVKVQTEDQETIQAPIVPIHYQGDSYILESVNVDSGMRNRTERKVISANSEKIITESTNIQSKRERGRKLEFTPEWNLVSVRNSDGSGLNYSPPLKYYEFPLSSGKTWRQTSIETNIKTGAIKEHTLSAIVGGWENVTVPAGTFRGVKVTVQTELFDRTTGQKTTGTDTSWYVPEVRRSVRSLTSSKKPEGVESRQDLQLISYDIINSVEQINPRSVEIPSNSNEDIRVVSPALPEDIASFIGIRGLKMPATISKYCRFDFKMNDNPFFVSGDFDGDGKLDHVIDVEDKNHLGKIFVFLASGRIHELGGWEYIYKDKRRGTIKTYQGNVNLEHDSIGGVKCESSSVLYVFNNTKERFDQYFTSD